MKRMLYPFIQRRRKGRSYNEHSLRYLAYHTKETFSMAGRETGSIEREGAAVCAGSVAHGPE
jgi:hypothetical protein